MADEDFEVFEGKTFSALLEDIYSASLDRRGEIDTTIKSISEMIKTPGDASVLSPIVQSLLDTSIKNNDQLVKLAQIVQKHIALKTKEAAASTNFEDLLTDVEKNALMEQSRHLQLLDSEIEDEFEEEVETLKRKIE